MDTQNQAQAPAPPESQTAPADAGAQNAGANAQAGGAPAAGQETAPPAPPADQGVQQAAPATTTATEMQPSEQEVTNAMAAKLTTAVLGLEVALILVMVASWWKILSKAQEAGWAILVPFYNLWIMLKVARLPGWYMILMFIPLVNLYASIRMTHRLSRSFGNSTGFTLGLIFLPLIFFPILAFGSSEYTALED